MTDDPFDRDPTVTHGVAAVVAPQVRRVVCANPSAMTFTGTASYLVGRDPLAVVDPGPDDAAHRAALLAAIGGAAVAAIIVTHAHRDHSGGAAALAAATGAPTAGFGPPPDPPPALAGLGGGEGIDRGFVPDMALAEGATLTVGEARLVALHTPGHLGDHLCFALDGTGVLFTGDHVMTWASSMVSPPEGDMAAYMASLRRLRARDDRLILPGHGRPSAAPGRLIDWLIAHREAREAQILTALADGPADAAALARRIYADVDARLLPAAARNVLAHLVALVTQGRAAAEGPLSAATRFHLLP